MKVYNGKNIIFLTHKKKFPAISLPAIHLQSGIHLPIRCHNLGAIFSDPMQLHN